MPRPGRGVTRGEERASIHRQAQGKGMGVPQRTSRSGCATNAQSGHGMPCPYTGKGKDGHEVSCPCLSPATIPVRLRSGQALRYGRDDRVRDGVLWLFHRLRGGEVLPRSLRYGRDDIPEGCPDPVPEMLPTGSGQVGADANQWWGTAQRVSKRQQGPCILASVRCIVGSKQESVGQGSNETCPVPTSPKTGGNT
jgi:hypothetical protein